MTFLVDANVLSEATKPKPDGRVVEWLLASERDFVINPIILGELYLGILLLAQSGRRRRLQQWFARLVETVDCLPWDAPTARRWAELLTRLRREGRAMPLLDSMIAATALEHDLTLVTRNARDFAASGVRVLDPFASRS